MKKFSAVIAICGLLFAANLAIAGHGAGILEATYGPGRPLATCPLPDLILRRLVEA